VRKFLRFFSEWAVRLKNVTKPHHITLFAALLGLAGAVCLAVAGLEPRAGAALGVALIAAVTALAMYLHDRQLAPGQTPRRNLSGVGSA